MNGYERGVNGRNVNILPVSYKKRPDVSVQNEATD